MLYLHALTILFKLENFGEAAPSAGFDEWWRNDSTWIFNFMLQHCYYNHRILHYMC